MRVFVRGRSQYRTALLSTNARDSLITAGSISSNRLDVSTKERTTWAYRRATYLRRYAPIGHFRLSVHAATAVPSQPFITLGTAGRDDERICGKETTRYPRRDSSAGRFPADQVSESTVTHLTEHAQRRHADVDSIEQPGSPVTKCAPKTRKAGDSKHSQTQFQLSHSCQDRSESSMIVCMRQSEPCSNRRTAFMVFKRCAGVYSAMSMPGISAGRARCLAHLQVPVGMAPERGREALRSI